MFEFSTAIRMLEEGKLAELREELVRGMLLEEAQDVYQGDLSHPEYITLENVFIGNGEASAMAEYRGYTFHVSVRW